jgi:hypothetical protein
MKKLIHISRVVTLVPSLGISILLSGFLAPQLAQAADGTWNGTNGATTFPDDSGKTWTRTGNAVISTAQSQFGGASAYFDGAGDYLSPSASNDFDLQGDFTVECWVYWSTVSGAAQRGVFQLNTSAAGPSTSVSTLAAHINASGNWAFYTLAGARQSTSAVPAGTWQHLAITRQSGILRMIAGGTKIDEITDANNYTGTGFAVGTYYSSAYRCDGFVDEFRVLKGTAAYTANFTPPTSPFPDA